MRSPPRPVRSGQPDVAVPGQGLRHLRLDPGPLQAGNNSPRCATAQARLGHIHLGHLRRFAKLRRPAPPPAQNVSPLRAWLTTQARNGNFGRCSGNAHLRRLARPRARPPNSFTNDEVALAVRQDSRIGSAVPAGGLDKRMAGMIRVEKGPVVARDHPACHGALADRIGTGTRRKPWSGPCCCGQGNGWHGNREIKSDTGTTTRAAKCRMS